MGRKKVLIIDDDKLIRWSLRHKLGDDYVIDFRFRQPGSQTDTRLGGSGAGDLMPLLLQDVSTVRSSWPFLYSSRRL